MELRPVRRRTQHRLAGGLLALGVLPGALALQADAAVRDHPTLVPTAPTQGYPLILNAPLIPLPNGTFQHLQVLATDQVGRYIVSGGDFQRIRLQNGSTIEHPYFAAWNIDTKQLVCPTLDFDNEVFAIAEGPSSHLAYVAGKFSKVTGADGRTVVRSKLALIDLDTCSIDATFVPGIVDLKIDRLAYDADRLFIGGDFTMIGTTDNDIVAELDPVTGTVIPAFHPDFKGAVASKIKALAISPDGTRLVMAGRFGTVANNGVSLDTETAVFDISDSTKPRLTAHSWRSPHDRVLQQDASVSPDGKWIGVVYRGTDAPNLNVFLISTAESPQTERWVHAMGNSVFGVGVSNNAVYVGGHFCRIAAGPGPTDPMSPAMGITDCDGHPDSIWRGHIAALSITDGTPLTWNPGADSSTGGRVFRVTTRGLLAGFDGERTDNIRTGALAFYDFGPGVEDSTAPGEVLFNSPAEGAEVTTDVRISGAATDNVGVAMYGVTIRADDGRFLQANATFAGRRVERRLLAGPDGGFVIDISLEAGAYAVEAVAFDQDGNRSNTLATRSFTTVNRPVDPPPTTGLDVIDQAADSSLVSAVRVGSPVGG